MTGALASPCRALRVVRVDAGVAAGTARLEARATSDGLVSVLFRLESCAGTTKARIALWAVPGRNVAMDCYDLMGKLGRTMVVRLHENKKP